MRTLDPAEIRPQPESVADAPPAEPSAAPGAPRAAATGAGAETVLPPAGPRQGFLLLVSGPSGAGKGTLVSHLIAQRPGCVFSVSATTRQRRATEFEGREYIFLDREEFERRVEQGWFLEWAHVHGNLYGTPLEEVDRQLTAGKVVVLDVDVQGGASVRRVRPDAVTVFVYPPSLDSLRARLEARGTDLPPVIDQRLQNAPGEIAQWVHYDYVIMNDRLEIAQAQLVAIHDAEHARSHRLGPR